MKINESSVDRVIRGVLGAILLVAGLALVKGTIGIVLDVIGVVLGLLGAVLILSGILGFCHVYKFFHISTSKKAQE